ncbi:hypothetical protein Fcan01_13497 [Folsomia candida]|uniref:Uncharacterized protein n=1 Tax=Folsomia candida TaxID=158441 RepID=A0A226E228_FOLCA|nr:hypothetical protein Fcan01_13497 [Folsomia candida]
MTDTVGHLANSQGYSGRLEGRKLNLLAGFRTVPELAYRVVDAPEWHTTAKKKIMENDLPADHYGVILTFTKGLHNASYNKGKVPWTPDDLSKALNAYSLPHVTLADVLKEHKINKSTINRASSTIVGWEKGRDNSAEIHAYIMKKYCHTAPCATITNQAASTSSSSLQHQEEEQEEEIILEESEKEKKLKQEVIELKHEITRLNNLIEKLEIENASFSCVCDGCF